MSWIEQNFEKHLFKMLKKELNNREDADKYYTHYKFIRNKLVDEIFPNIPVQEPGLTDHTSKHIQNVMGNAFIILDKGNIKGLTGWDWYFLGMTILFHDVGNVFDRDEHYKYETITKIYDEFLHKDANYKRERYQVATAAEAHSGFGRDGSKDTMKNINSIGDIDGGYPIKLRDVAVILRLADELAEGPQRTSYFMQKNHLLPKNSIKFHEYASQTSVFIDKPHERIALTYDLNIESKSEKNLQKLKSQLEYIYGRVHKLDQERKYARHYSLFCEKFKKTTVAINITVNNKRVIELNNCTLDDLTIPGEDDYKSLEKRYDDYQVVNIINKISNSNA